MRRAWLAAVAVLFLWAAPAGADSGLIYDTGELKPVDSVLKVAVGDEAPDFELPAVGGGTVRLSDFRGRRNVVLSFVPAAWTPVCSDQWPGYNLALDLFKQYDAELIGISEDNTPSQYAWIKEMGGLNFTVLSDFWPHGEAAKQYGILRSDGTAERALFVIDKQGIIRFILVGDINRRPDLGLLVDALSKLPK
ncbi:MAG: peroxiredoxin [Desulfovibrionaceae bacterium]|nr:peroxiredoxin [Desulfovibrionaceae bacterium]